MRMLTLPALAGLAVAAGLVPAQEPKPAGPPDVPALVRDLGSPDYSVREAATAALGKTPAAYGPLGEVTADRNPEVARRAGQALAALRKRLGPARLKRLPEYAKARQVDRLVEAMAAWPEAVTVADRQLTRVLARDVLAWVGKQFGPKLPEVWIEVPDLEPAGPHAAPLTVGRHVDVFGLGDTIADTLDATPHPGNPYRYGGAFVGTNLPGCVLTYTNGDIKYFRPPVGSAGMISGLNVCNGDVVIEHAIHTMRAVVLCTGNARLDFRVADSVVVAGGGITGQNLDDHAQRPDVLLRPKEPKLAEFLRFYDCAAEGLHVRADGQSVFVTKVDAGKPFAAAGIRPGDRVVKVDGKPVRSVRELNRLLCRAEVGYPGTAAVFLARGEKGVDAAVKLAEPPTLDP